MRLTPRPSRRLVAALLVAMVGCGSGVTAPGGDELAAARVRWARRGPVTYGPALGHPVRVLVDPDAVVADDEVTYTVSELRASG
jgi:hypothetical protein